MTEKRIASPQEQSEILMQALPHMLRYDEAIIVVKYGGHAMGDEIKGRLQIVTWHHREQALDGAGLLVNSTQLGLAGHRYVDT